MAALNPDQFGARSVGVFKGEPGEPDPDMYNRQQDWLQDHKRFVNNRSAGKPYVDPAMQQIKSHAKQADDAFLRENRAVDQGHAQTRNQVLQGLRGLNKAAGRMGMRKRKKIW